MASNVNLEHAALTIGVRVWQLVWGIVLLAASAAVIGMAGVSDLHSVNFGVFLGLFCSAVAILYMVAARTPGSKLDSVLPGVVDGALSSLLVLLCLAAAASIGNGLSATCRFVSSVMNWARTLGVGGSGGDIAEGLCAAAQLATAAAILLFFSYIVTAVFGFMGMWQGKGLVKLSGGGRGAARHEVQMPAAGADAVSKA